MMQGINHLISQPRKAEETLFHVLTPSEISIKDTNE